jgi:hypothetical protein
MNQALFGHFSPERHLCGSIFTFTNKAAELFLVSWHAPVCAESGRRVHFNIFDPF